MIFTSLCISHQRLGPSASEAALEAANDVKMMELVANLTKVKDAVSDPSLKLVLQSVAPQLLTLFPPDDDDADKTVEDAEKGLPAPSRPTKRSRVEKPRPTPTAVAPKVSPAVAPTAVVPPAATPTHSPTSVVDSSAEGLPVDPVGVKEPKDPKGINSSSHRAEHARLARRMERIDPSEFPNMAKLWSGTRKDWFVFHILVYMSNH